MGKKIADKGSSEAFLRANVDFDKDYCLLWPFRLTGSGYGLAVINGEQLHAHRWMTILVYGEPRVGETDAAHACGNRNCVNPRHLRWASHRDNMQDTFEHGTHNRGENCGHAKLTEQQVWEIWQLKGKLPPEDVAKRYPVQKNAIRKIWFGERWAHLTKKWAEGAARNVDFGKFTDTQHQTEGKSA